jgi:hypothetical protein
MYLNSDVYAIGQKKAISHAIALNRNTHIIETSGDLGLDPPVQYVSNKRHEKKLNVRSSRAYCAEIL